MKQLPILLYLTDGYNRCLDASGSTIGIGACAKQNQMMKLTKETVLLHILSKSSEDDMESALYVMINNIVSYCVELSSFSLFRYPIFNSNTNRLLHSPLLNSCMPLVL